MTAIARKSGAKVRLFYCSDKFISHIFCRYHWENEPFCVFLGVKLKKEQL